MRMRIARNSMLNYLEAKRLSLKFEPCNETVTKITLNQVVIAQWLAQQFATGEVPGSNPCNLENFLIPDQYNS